MEIEETGATTMTKSTIKITYKYIDGAHFFVTDDKEALGFCVAHNDLKVAYEEVSNQLSALFEYNHGVKATFIPSVPFEEFKKFTEASSMLAKGVMPPGEIVPSSIQPWMHTVLT
jgi:hypothetical protein